MNCSGNSLQILNFVFKSTKIHVMINVKVFTFSPIQENTYILSDEHGSCAIIDPGCYFDEEKEELKNYIEKTRLKPVLLLNTHCHVDHVLGNSFVKGADPHQKQRASRVSVVRRRPPTADRSCVCFHTAQGFSFPKFLLHFFKLTM